MHDKLYRQRALWPRYVAALVPALLLCTPMLLAAGGPPAPTEQIWKFTARFHAVILHLPIGLLGFVYLLELYGFLRPSSELRRIISFALVCSSLSAVAVAALGLLLAREGGYDPTNLTWHKWLGLAFVGLTLSATILHLRTYRRKAAPHSKLPYRAVLGATAILLVFAGHYGGNLTHGSQYLTKYAPDFVKNLVTAPGKGRTGDAGTVADVGEFAEQVRPILAAKCFQCHGPEKQKGGYRADLADTLFQAGDSGAPPIVAGAPMQSHLVRLLLLPQEHEDAMPPEGKEPLTAEEIVRVARWIQDGARLAPDSDFAQLGESSPRGSKVEIVAIDKESAVDERAQQAPDTRSPDDNVAPISEKQPTEVVEAASSSSSSSTPGEAVDFATHIRPILEANCIPCHNKKKRRGRLALHDLESARKGGRDHGPAVIPGDPDSSSLLALVKIQPQDEDADLMMPPDGDGDPLSATQIALIDRWLKEGAKWPDDIVLKRPPKKTRLATRG